jgi:twitching motility protein PilT
MTVNLRALLEEMIEKDASDLHIVAGERPKLRVDGDMGNASTEEVMTPKDTLSLAYSVLTETQKKRFETESELDFSFGIQNLARFRGNCFKQRGCVSLVIRQIPFNIRTFDDLGLPSVVAKLAERPRGLVLVTGPTGSGKSTTLAALVDEINRRDARHIVTIEDPIEYEHLHHRSVVEQVEIGVDAPDFPTALRAALRQAPDVIVVGEMRDPETMQIALAAGETGHLVFSTLHTTDVASTVSRIADSFPLERQNTVRQELAMSLAAVMTQTLLTKVGGGVVPGAELLMVGYGARQHIRRNALQHLHQEITISRKYGSFTFEESLARLVKDGLVEWSDAHARAPHTEAFEQLAPPPS